MACALLPVPFAMKPRDYNTNANENWVWPEKTWFRERLNNLRAQEHEALKRSAATRQARRGVETQPAGKPEGENK